MEIKKLGQRGALIGLMALSIAVGATGGAALFRSAPANAQSVTTAQVAPAASPAVSPTDNDTETNDDKQMEQGKFKPNEDPAHEKDESPEREAQEDAGQRPSVK